MNMKREPAQGASARVLRGGCTWKRHPDLPADFEAYPVEVVLDRAWLATLKQLLRRAAQGTVRNEEWEYPCATARGQIGELKMTHAHEFERGGEMIDLLVWHRIYYHEPGACPSELWAMSAGCKVDGDETGAAHQQEAIERACSRVAFTDLLGRDLREWQVS